MSEDDVVPGTRKALLLLAGHFSFSGDLLAEDWMLKQAGFVDGARCSPSSTDVVAQVRHGHASTHGHNDTLTNNF
jgi:hypothetical protein